MAALTITRVVVAQLFIYVWQEAVFGSILALIYHKSISALKKKKEKKGIIVAGLLYLPAVLRKKKADIWQKGSDSFKTKDVELKLKSRLFLARIVGRIRVGKVMCDA